MGIHGDLMETPRCWTAEPAHAKLTLSMLEVNMGTVNILMLDIHGIC
jgi:hypothetical protein